LGITNVDVTVIGCFQCLTEVPKISCEQMETNKRAVFDGFDETKKKKKRRLEQDLCFLEALADTLLNKAESSHSVKYVTEAKSLCRTGKQKTKNKNC
jgi:hypothetical protein